MSSTHTAHFTWPATYHSTVIVTGTFDNWSGNTHHLTKQPDGKFVGTVQVPWGEKIAYKYVCDGQWMTREDEAKEWDLAGNMNNVYTAPPAPTEGLPSATSDTAPAVTETTPDALIASKAPGPAEDAKPTVKDKVEEKKEEVESKVEGKRSGGYYTADFGAPVGNKGVPVVAAPTSTAETKAPVPPTESAVTAASVTPSTTATTAAPTSSETKPPAGPATTDEKAETVGATLLAGLTAAASTVVTGVNEAVHAVTGVDIVKPDPVPAEEAKKEGIDTAALPAKEEKVVAPSATLPPTINGTKVPETGEPTGQASIPLPAKADTLTNGPTTTKPEPNLSSKSAALQQSVDSTAPAKAATAAPSEPKQPDVFSSNAPGSDSVPKVATDIPAQHETKAANHQTVPQPVITDISAPTKDRTQPTTADATVKPVSSKPDVDVKKAKEETVAAIDGEQPSRSYVKKPEETTPAAASGLPLTATTKPSTGPKAETPVLPSTPSKSTPVVPAKDTPAAPVTPASKVAASDKRASTASPASTAASTPMKKKDDGPIRVRKSSFFTKLKNTFGHKKDA